MSIALVATPFSDFTRFACQRIDSALDKYTSAGLGLPARLQEAMRYSLLSPGKRLRPQLTLLATQACGGAWDAALPAACAVEMVHTYSLIHDDLPAMDDDDLRRGRPTNHKVYGEALAILAGDALLTLAFEIAARDIRPPETAAACCAALAAAAGGAGMVGGQVDDLAAEEGSGDLVELESIHARKTGAMFLAALRLGGLCARAAPVQQQALDAYGERLGLAFQIMDDLLDVRGNEAAAGKRLGKDQQRGKLTFPGLLGVEESSRRARALGAEACAALAPLGAGAAGLESLAQFVLERDR